MREYLLRCRRGVVRLVFPTIYLSNAWPTRYLGRMGQDRMRAVCSRLFVLGHGHTRSLDGGINGGDVHTKLLSLAVILDCEDAASLSDQVPYPASNHEMMD